MRSLCRHKQNSPCLSTQNASDEEDVSRTKAQMYCPVKLLLLFQSTEETQGLHEPLDENLLNLLLIPTQLCWPFEVLGFQQRT